MRQRTLISLVAAVTGAAVLAQPARARGEEKWEEEVAGIESRFTRAAPAPGGVLFVGSSSIRMWKLDRSFPGLKPLNAGFGGSRIADSHRYGARLIHAWKPRTVVMYAGDNDLAGGLTPDEVVRDFTAFATSLHGALPDSRLVYLSIKPSASRWHLWPQVQEANARIRALCESVGEPRLRFVDVATPLLGEDGKPDPGLFLDDRLHLNEAGYDVWRGVLAEVLAGAR